MSVQSNSCVSNYFSMECSGKDFVTFIFLKLGNLSLITRSYFFFEKGRMYFDILLYSHIPIQIYAEHNQT